MAVDLQDGRAVWQQPGSVSSRILVGEDVLVHVAPERESGATTARPMLLARDLATGAVRWMAPLADEHQKLVGCDASSTTLVCVSRSGDELRGGSSLLWAVDLASGSARWQKVLPYAHTAAPALSGQLLAVPNRSQFVSLYDASSGAELGEALSRETSAEFVRADSDGLYYGHTTDGAYRLAPESALGTRQSPAYLHAKLPTFVRAVYGADMYRPTSFDYSAIDRNRILWRGEHAGDGHAQFRGGTVTVLNYRFFFGFDAASGELRWAYSQPDNEAVGAADTGRDLVYVTVDGEIGALDRTTGQRTLSSRLALPSGTLVKGVSFDADGFHGPGGSGTSSLVSVLAGMLWDKDRRFPDLKVFVVNELARQPGSEATEALLRALAASDLLPPAAIAKAGEALATRKDGASADLFVAALKEHADFIDHKRRPPIAVLAKAVASASARSAVPALVAHLRRPETEAEDVVQIARAVTALGAREAVPALEDYLALYRADPEAARFPAPLQAAAEAVLALGGPAGAEFLRYLADDGKTDEALSAHIARALAGESNNAAMASSQSSQAAGQPKGAQGATTPATGADAKSELKP
jgi:outer membrane protein assembly factor BamB